jgi:hypothetical protein
MKIGDEKVENGIRRRLVATSSGGSRWVKVADDGSLMVGKPKGAKSTQEIDFKTLLMVIGNTSFAQEVEDWMVANGKAGFLDKRISVGTVWVSQSGYQLVDDCVPKQLPVASVQRPTGSKAVTIVDFDDED